MSQSGLESKYARVAEILFIFITLWMPIVSSYPELVGQNQGGWSEPEHLFPGSHPSLIQDSNGTYWMAYNGRRLGTDIFLTNSSDGTSWAEPWPATFNPADERDPQIMLDANGRFFLVFVSDRNGSRNIFVKSSANALRWSDAIQITYNYSFTGYPNTLLQDASGTYWVAFTAKYSESYDIYLTGSKDGLTWTESQRLTREKEIETFPTMIQDRKGVYWLAFSRETGKPNKFDTFLMSSMDAKRWSEPIRITRGPANNNYIDFILDASGIYWLAFTSTRSGNEDIFIMGSYDANTWSITQQLTFNMINRTRDFKCDYKTLMQDRKGELWVVYGCAKRPEGLWYVRGYTGPEFGYGAGQHKTINTPLGKVVLRQLTVDTYPQGRPSWSRDGSSIAYVSKKDYKDGEIWVMDPVGGKKKRVISDPAGGDFPSWRPDGMIVYSHSIEGLDISVTNPATGQRADLTTRAKNQHFASYSPDGKRIVYVSDEAGSNDIYVMNADTSANARLTFDATHENAPSWAPGGKQIAFESNKNGNWDIFVMGSDGKNIIRLTSGTANEGHPSFSPDGKRIVYMSDESGGFNLYVMDADGTGKMRLTKGFVHDMYPYWSPDGKSIVFESYRSGNPDIWVIDISGVNLSYQKEETVEYETPVGTPIETPSGTPPTKSEDTVQTVENDEEQPQPGPISKIKEIIWRFIERFWSRNHNLLN